MSLFCLLVRQAQRLWLHTNKGVINFNMQKQIFGIVLFFMLCNLTVIAQNGEKRYGLGFGDVYVLNAEIEKNIFQNKSTCVYQRGTVCSLYKIKVTRVLYCPSNNVFDSSSLMNLEYIIAPIRWDEALKPGLDFLITAMPSSSSKYLALTRVLNKELLNDHTFYHEHAYLSDLLKCKRNRKDLFAEYIRFQNK